MGKSILVFVEQRDGSIKKPSLEAVSEGKRLATRLEGAIYAVVIGNGVKKLVDTIGQYGTDTVYVVDDVRFGKYTPEGYGQAIAEIAKKVSPYAILFASTGMGKDLAPTVAAILGTSVATDCTGIEIANNELIILRPVYAGKVFVQLRFKSPPAVISLRPNVFKVEMNASEKSSIEEVKSAIADDVIKTQVKEVVAASGGKVELTEASVIVSGGRGFKGPENFNLRDKLAEVLGAAVGASRAVVDAGWRPHSEQVGQTGKTVSTNLYIAIGISGAIQHLAGMSSSKVIVAINKDADAPIFKIATYGVVGDLFEVVPALTEEFKKVLSK